jgi:hypothetical protein
VVGCGIRLFPPRSPRAHPALTRRSPGAHPCSPCSPWLRKPTATRRAVSAPIPRIGAGKDRKTESEKGPAGSWIVAEPQLSHVHSVSRHQSPDTYACFCISPKIFVFVTATPLLSDFFIMDALAIRYDGLLYAESDDVYDNWRDTLTDARMRELENFVASRISDRGPAKFVSQHQGSYNMVFRFSFAFSSSDVALRSPKPGHAASTLAQEKTANEVAWMEFLKEKTSIPLPRVYSYGTEPGFLSPLELPYILMDWLPGDNLRRFLASGPSNELRLSIYQQVASFYLQLYGLPPFTAIGSIAMDKTTGKWDITKRPLTIDMHQFVLGIHNFPTDHWPAGALESASDYFDFVMSQHKAQLWSLRNINAGPNDSPHIQADDPETISETARRRYKARYGFSQLVPEFCEVNGNLGTFCVFNPDIDSRNMLVDSETGKITGVVDMEFTNTMPAQFAHDPPLWLFKVLPDQCLDRGLFAWFLREYEPILEQFLDAMRREESKITTPFGKTPLSSHMKNSWTTHRVWFDYAATHTDHVDSVYWEVLYKHHVGNVAPELPEPLRHDMERYVQHTKDQLVAYGAAWTQRILKTRQ